MNTEIAIHMPSEKVAWTYYQLGEYQFQAGDLAGAAAAYQEAVNQLPGYYRGLSGLAKVRVAQQKYPEAIGLYKQAIEEVPFPDFIAALGDVYLKAGQSEAAQKQYDLVEYVGHLSELNKQTYNRELALFYADRGIKLPQSLELAQKELEVRRDVYTQDVLAWSLYRNGRVKEAADATDKALGLGTKDAVFYFHAGLIYRDVGDVNRSRDYLARALAIDPQFHIFYADAARQALESMTAKQTAKTEGLGQ